MPPETAKEQGFLRYDLGRYSEAHPLLERAFAGGLDDPELVVRLAHCRTTVKEDPTGAINILRDSALKYPDYARTYYELGFIAHDFGPTDDFRNVLQAIGFTRKAVELDPDDWRFKDNLGMFYLEMRELDSAMAFFQAARVLTTDYPELNARIEQTHQLLEEKARLDSLAVADTVELKP